MASRDLVQSFLFCQTCDLSREEKEFKPFLCYFQKATLHKDIQTVLFQNSNHVKHILISSICQVLAQQQKSVSDHFCLKKLGHTNNQIWKSKKLEQTYNKYDLYKPYKPQILEDSLGLVVTQGIEEKTVEIWIILKVQQIMKPNRELRSVPVSYKLFKVQRNFVRKTPVQMF